MSSFEFNSYGEYHTLVDFITLMINLGIKVSFTVSRDYEAIDTLGKLEVSYGVLLYRP